MNKDIFYPPFGFLAPDPQLTAYESSRVVILPVPYDATTTARAGAREGPSAIIDASQDLESYDLDPRLRHLSTTASTRCPTWRRIAIARRRWSTAIESAVGGLLDDGKFVVTLGGEHTVAVGAVRAHAPPLS